MPIADQTLHTPVAATTTAAKIVPALSSGSSRTKIDRTHAGFFVPESFTGKVYVAIINHYDADGTTLDPNDATVKAAIYGVLDTSSGQRTFEAEIGEDMELWAWTDAGSVTLTGKSYVVRRALV